MRRDGPREQQNQNDIAKKQQQKDQEKNQRGIERESMHQNYRLHCRPYLTLKDENRIIQLRKL